MSEPARSLARQAHTHDEPALAPSAIEPAFPKDGDIELDARTLVARPRLMWDSRRFILQATVTGLLLSLAISLVIPKRFESTVRLMPPDQGALGSGMAMLAAASASIASQMGSGIGSLAGDLSGLKNSSDLFLGILQSRTVEDDLINKFDLRKLYWDKRMEDAREDLSKRTTLSVDRKSGIISIQVVDHDPWRAAAMAGEYASELNMVVTQLNTSSAHRERVFLEDRLAQVKQDLETAEKDFSEFATKNTALDIPTQGRAMIEAAASLEGELIATQTELQGLKQVYAEGNVRVRSTQARVDELRRQLQKNLQGTPPDQNSSGKQDRTTLYPSIRELPVLGVSYEDLYRNTKIQEAVFQTLTEEYELAKVQEAKETPSVKILDPPDIPEKKSFPPRLLIIVLGTLTAIAGSVCWILCKRAWECTPAENPQKVLLQEILEEVRTSVPLLNRNGAAAHASQGETEQVTYTQVEAEGDRTN